MSITVHAYAARAAGAPFEAFTYELPELGPDDVDVQVAACGLCHSDLSMLENDWGFSQYPFVGGHEATGTVVAVGEHVPNLKVGDTVGVGWYARSCMHCDQCIGGRHNLCGEAQGTITHQFGGFADRVRCHWGWATPLPAGLDPRTAGPLFCGGITVFNPILQHQIAPTARVGVIGIGGLGHLALQFLNKWGCEVTAFSTRPDKEAEAKALGAHHFVNTKDDAQTRPLTGAFDLILNTTNAGLDWDQYVTMLAPRGVLHTVGAVPSAFGVSHAFPLISGQKSLSGSPLGSPLAVRQMLAFCARHQIAPITETLPFEKINDAFDQLRHGSPRYRLVLTH